MPDKNNIKYYAQELKLNTYNLTRMNLIMRGIKPDNIVVRNADTLEDDWPYFDEEDPINSYNPLYVDAVVSNPPYSQKWNPENKEHDPRYARFGIAPKGKADYAFLLHDLYHVKPDGIMTIVLPHGVLFRGGEEGTIRKNLIEGNYIDAIIGLPANIFYGTSIPTIVMVLKQTRSTNDILIIDASKGYTKEGKNNKLRASDIRRIADTVSKRANIEKYSRVVSIEEIRKNDYNLNIPRYVDSSQEPESWDIYATMFGGIPLTEIESLSSYWQAFPKLKSALIKHIDAAYVELISDDIKKTIKEHPDVIEYADNFKKAFDGFDEYLQETWIDHMNSVNTNMSEMEVSKDIFKRLENIPLVDKYDAYEILDKEWQTIATDLEIIQTEGYDSIRKVDPNLILQKKGDKKEEIQKGWKGHIIPFELIQKEILHNEYEELKQKENRIAEISSEYEELFESLTEEEKECEVVNDDSTAFVPKEIPKKLKELHKEEQSEEVVAFIQKLSKYEALNKEEKALKREIKTKTDQLHMRTKEIIETLSDEMIYDLLTKKWIHNLIQNINKLPETIINNLVFKLQAIHKKYETTYLQIESEIKETSKQLAEMIDQLVGDEYDMKGLEEFKALLLGE